MNYENLLQEIKEEFPEFKLVSKNDSMLMKFINMFLLIISFGKNDKFMKEYVSTINCTVYYPLNWESNNEKNKLILLRHERIHMRQAKRLTPLVFSFLYLFAYFPFFFATFRTKFEQEAYEESIKAAYEYYGPIIFKSKNYRQYIIDQFTTAAYGWMCPFKNKIENWYDSVIKNLQ